jgi:hypothetical protein
MAGWILRTGLARPIRNSVYDTVANDLENFVSRQKTEGRIQEASDIN